MTTSMVSTYSLGAAMLSGMARAQNELTQLTAESSSGQYADLGLQLGDQSGHELSLRNQTNLLQTLVTANNLTVTNLKTAQAALELDPHHRQKHSLDADLDDRRVERRHHDPADRRDQRAAGADLRHQHHLHGQYVFGGDNSAVAPMADYFSSTTSAAKSAIDAAFQSTFGFAPTSASASTISASAMQSFLSGPFADPVQRPPNWSGATRAPRPARPSGRRRRAPT